MILTYYFFTETYKTVDLNVKNNTEAKVFYQYFE